MWCYQKKPKYLQSVSWCQAVSQISQLTPDLILRYVWELAIAAVLVVFTPAFGLSVHFGSKLNSSRSRSSIGRSPSWTLRTKKPELTGLPSSRAVLLQSSVISLHKGVEHRSTIKSLILAGSTTEIIQECSRCIHKPQSNVTAVSIEGPTGNAAGAKKRSISIHIHRPIRASAHTKLIAISECHRDARAMLHPTLRGMIGPHLYRVPDTIVPHVDHATRTTQVALRFQDQALLITGSSIDLGQCDVGFLIAAKRRILPENKGSRTVRDNI